MFSNQEIDFLLRLQRGRGSEHYTSIQKVGQDGATDLGRQLYFASDEDLARMDHGGKAHRFTAGDDDFSFNRAADQWEEGMMQDIATAFDFDDYEEEAA